MNHEGDGETPEEDRVRPVGRKVTFESDYDNGECCSRESDVDLATPCAPNGHQHETSACSNGSHTKGLYDADKKQSSSKVVGILRHRSIPPSPLVFQALMSTRRFKQSKLSKAMMRSNETRGLIEILKKQIFQRLKHQRRDPNPHFVRSSLSLQSRNCLQRASSLTSQERRMICLKSTKDMMNQSLPASMMPFVEETLKAAHFIYRRRKENGHGRIVHKILIEQHKQIVKELERNGDKNGESSSTKSAV